MVHSEKHSPTKVPGNSALRRYDLVVPSDLYSLAGWTQPPDAENNAQWCDRGDGGNPVTPSRSA